MTIPQFRSFTIRYLPKCRRIVDRVAIDDLLLATRIVLDRDELGMLEQSVAYLLHRGITVDGIAYRGRHLGPLLLSRDMTTPLKL